MKNGNVLRMAKIHSLNAVNRVEFAKPVRFDDPYKRLAAAVIVQSVIDSLNYTDERHYWYYGQLVRCRNKMYEEDYRFYADIAGIEYSWDELLRNVEKSGTIFRGHALRDAALLLCI